MTEENIKISFVLPVYNGQTNIARCLQSLIEQEGPKEIIVIIDGCTDNTERIVRHYEEHWTDRKGDGFVIIKSNGGRRGAAVCRNVGNSIASGNVIAVCDVDIYYKTRAKAIREFFTQNHGLDIFYSSLHLRDADDERNIYLMEAYEWDFKSKCPISHPTIAYRTKVSDVVTYHEDSIETDLFEFFLLDANKKGYKFGGCQNPLMLKIEGDRKRNWEESKKLKQAKYKKYGIEVEL